MSHYGHKSILIESYILLKEKHIIWLSMQQAYLIA